MSALGRSKAFLSREDIPPGMWIMSAGGTAALAIQVLVQALTPGLSWRREFVRQFVFSFRVTLLPGALVSFVVGFSTIGILGGSVASVFGAIDRISSAAPVAFLRVLGPLLTAAVVAGAVGSTITAELGARKIRDELQALEVLGVNPVRNLVLPRVAGLVLWMPVLSLLTVWAGIAGTFCALVVLYGSTPEAFFSQLFLQTNYIDLWGSVLQLTLFGFVIAIVSAFKGMDVTGGADGVGRAVNASVVSALITVALIAVVYTMLFQAFYPEVNFGG